MCLETYLGKFQVMTNFFVVLFDWLPLPKPARGPARSTQEQRSICGLLKPQNPGPRVTRWRDWRACTRPQPGHTKRCSTSSSTAFDSKENTNSGNDIISLAISPSARIKTSTTHHQKGDFFHPCKPQRQKPDCLHDSLGLSCRCVMALDSNSFVPE